MHTLQHTRVWTITKSKEFEDEAANDDIVATNVVKRGITKLHKFRNQHDKGVKNPLTIDDMGRISGTN